MNNPLVSVIVPIYNVEMYLDRCINSIVNQSYQNIEIILVDDGSPDNCSSMCEFWKEKDDRVVVLHKTNGGLSSARNAGIYVSHGEFLCFVDSDDFIDKTMIETMINAIYKFDSDLACCGRYVLYDNGKIEEEFTLPKEKTISSTKAMQEMLRGTYIGEPAWDKLYKRSLFDEIKFPEGEINEDIVILPLIFKKCSRIVHVSKPLYYYCKNGESITRSGYSPKKHIIIEHLNQIENIIEKYYPNLKKEYKCFKAKYSLYMLYLILEDKETKKKYIDDYICYYNNLKSNFILFVLSPYLNYTEKIKGFLILTNVYLTLKSFLQRRILNE
ncbi:glycosyltransferase family 2 protein [Candidatus Stoquefichus massiliensis]|uniref:glycosyltransferase family 2 protein n=1 Tax=Candidatus Stoquefichus massiliensis TaxID=1470350 RepID=UPI0004B1D48F|nr:glycosyltransferase [Candidatus Stoquefichus massiliensis]